MKTILIGFVKCGKDIKIGATQATIGPKSIYRR